MNEQLSLFENDWTQIRWIVLKLGPLILSFWALCISKVLNRDWSKSYQIQNWQHLIKIKNQSKMQLSTSTPQLSSKSSVRCPTSMLNLATDSTTKVLASNLFDLLYYFEFPETVSMIATQNPKNDESRTENFGQIQKNWKEFQAKKAKQSGKEYEQAVDANEHQNPRIRIKKSMPFDPNEAENGQQQPTQSLTHQDWKSIDKSISQIITILRKLQKNNAVDEIEKICIGNRKIYLLAKFLFADRYSIILLSFFTHLLLSPKLINYLIKLNVPFLIYRNLVKILEKERERNSFSVKDREIEESFKFVHDYCRVQTVKFPRSFANLINILIDPSALSNQLCSLTQNCQSLILQTAIEVLKGNLELAEESQILTSLYDKVLKGDFQADRTRHVLQILINYCVKEKTRTIILGSIDLSKAFCTFNNVDSNSSNSVKQSEEDREEALQKAAVIIEMLLSWWPSMIYLLSEKATLTNFFKGLGRKPELERRVIKEQILRKIIDRTLRYSKAKARQSQNELALKSNCLNYCGLVLIRYLLKFNELYEVVSAVDGFEGELLQSLSQLCLEYYPSVFENDKYNKKVIKNIKFGEHYERFIHQSVYQRSHESENYNELVQISLKSFGKQSLIPYEFNFREIRDFLVTLKGIVSDQDSNSTEGELEQLETLLTDIKSRCRLDPGEATESDLSSEQNQEAQAASRKNSLWPSKNDSKQPTRVERGSGGNQEMSALLASCYEVAIRICRRIPWKAEYLTVAQFLSSVVQFLVLNEFEEVENMLLAEMRNLFQSEQNEHFYRYLSVSVLDDVGKYMIGNEECQSLLIQHCRDEDYSFRISQVLLNVDFEKSQNEHFPYRQQINRNVMDPPKLVEFFCSEGSSDYLLEQIIEVIKKNVYEHIEKYEHEGSTLIEIVSQGLIYHPKEEIAGYAAEFLEEMATKTSFMERYLRSIELDRIPDPRTRDRVIYLLIQFEEGFQKVFETHSDVLKGELEKWFSNQPETPLKDHSNFLIRETQKFCAVSNKNKNIDSYLFLGFEESERRNLILLPWNIKINDQHFVALAEYKMLKEKLKLKVRANKKIESQVTISVINIGCNSFGKPSKDRGTEGGQNSTILTVRREEVLRVYEKNQSHAEKRTQVFVVTKESVHLFFRYDGEEDEFELVYLHINVFLARSIYRPYIYPFNLISCLTMTKSGIEFLRRERNIQEHVESLKPQESDGESFKHSLLFLTVYHCSSRVEPNEKLQFYRKILQVYNDSSNYQVKEIAHWALNVICKDEEIRRQLKEEKKWKATETKYCQCLVFYPYSQESLPKQERNKYAFIRDKMPEKPVSASDSNRFLTVDDDKALTLLSPQIEQSFLILEFREVHEFLNNEVKELEMINSQRLQKLRSKKFSNQRVFEWAVQYMSLMNYSHEKINIVFSMYKNYLRSSKFENDFQSGFSLP